MSTQEHVWSIGELAAATGLTVRTLHHYDEIGLARPSLRTHAGHRRYTATDVRRLHRVLALRGSARRQQMWDQLSDEERAALIARREEAAASLTPEQLKALHGSRPGTS
jgi:DNA-binding transcriptional MerR regulator